MSRKAPVELPTTNKLHPYSRKARQERKKKAKEIREGKRKQVMGRFEKESAEPFLWFKASLLQQPEKRCYTIEETIKMIEEYFIEKEEKVARKRAEAVNRQGVVNKAKMTKAEAFADLIHKRLVLFESSSGIEFPNITTKEGVEKLLEWEGDWSWISGKLIPTRQYSKQMIKQSLPKLEVEQQQ